MAQNKNKPKHSKAERLAKKRRNQHLAKVKLAEKRQQITQSQAQEISNIIIKAKTQQLKSFKPTPNQTAKTIKTAQEREKQSRQDKIKADINKAQEISDKIVQNQKEIEALNKEYFDPKRTRSYTEILAEKTAIFENTTELESQIDDLKYLPQSSKDAVKDYINTSENFNLTELTYQVEKATGQKLENPWRINIIEVEQKEYAIITKLAKDEFHNQQKKVESVIQVVDIFQTTIDAFMAGLPVKTQDFLLDCVNELIDEVGLDVVQQRLFNSQAELFEAILDPYERYEKIDKVEQATKKFLDIIYAGHIPGRVLSKLNTVLALEERVGVYWSKKKGEYFFR